MPRFENVGLYDGLFVMQDDETRTLWNHITGEAIYGPHVGRTLGPMGNMLQMSAAQALAGDQAIQVAISNWPYIAGGRRRGAADGRAAVSTLGDRFGPENPNARLTPAFVDTLGTEDARLPRMTMGLGIVTDATTRFYATESIHERGALIDDLDGRQILVFVDRTTFTPAAVFVNASSATLDRRDVRLDTGGVVRDGLLYDADGTRADVARPQQFFTRWYGFALTFPDPEIFGR